MKNTILTTLFASLSILAASSAIAHDGDEGKDHHGPFMDFPLPGVLNDFVPKEGPCSQLKLDKDQKEKLKQAFFKFKAENIDLESQSEKAHLRYFQLMTNNDTTLKDVQDASHAVVESMSNKMQAEMSYHNEIAFGILRADQRGPAHACMMSQHEREHGRMHDKEKAPHKD